MKYHELTTTAKKSAKRVGRGIAAGRGKTAGRGTKGQGARAGYSKKPGFEGGQNPLMQRLPKLRGFRSLKPKVENVYTDELATVGTNINNSTLASKGLVTNAHTAVKLLYRGEVTKAHTISLQGISTRALDTIQSAGGSFTQTPRVKREKQNKKD